MPVAVSPSLQDLPFEMKMVLVAQPHSVCAFATCQQVFGAFLEKAPTGTPSILVCIRNMLVEVNLLIVVIYCTVYHIKGGL